MPLTNAEKQARSRQRKAERVARLENALLVIANMRCIGSAGLTAKAIAQNALAKD